MRNFDEDNITQAVIDGLSGCTIPRTRQIITRQFQIGFFLRRDKFKKDVAFFRDRPTFKFHLGNCAGEIGRENSALNRVDATDGR